MVCWKVDVSHASDSLLTVVSSPSCSYGLFDLSIAERNFDRIKVQKYYFSQRLMFKIKKYFVKIPLRIASH